MRFPLKMEVNFIKSNCDISFDNYRRYNFIITHPYRAQYLYDAICDHFAPATLNCL